ncbi:MAG: ABC transporter substrate-binding protein [Rhizobiaceae bacterium]|nr:ABC transporter substrate-binding protein [Rhizobiaceae bacterium]
MTGNDLNPLFLPTRRQFLKAGAALSLASTGILSTGQGAFAAPTKGGRLKIGTTGSSSDSLDPNLAVSSNASWYRINQLYGSLLTYTTSLEGPVSKTKLSLAEEVTSKSASQWVVRLKKGLTFHDGRPITADDLIFSVKRALQPDNQLLQLYKHIDGDNLRKIDDLTVEINLSTPDALARDWLPQIFILPQDFDPQNPVGSGPFKFKSYQAGTRSTFERFDAFPGDNGPYLDEIVTYSFNDETARINALMAGQLHWAPDMPRSQVNIVKSNPDLQIVEAATGQMHIAGMNVSGPPFDDADARLAFKHLFDRQSIIDQVYNGYGKVSNDLFMPQDPAFLNAPVRAHDPDKAKFLLKKAGLTDTTFTLTTSPTFPDIVELAAALAQQGMQSGVNIKVEKLDPSVYYGPDYAKRSFATANWAGSPISYFVRFALLSVSPYNQTAWADKDFDETFAAATAELDETRRNQHLQDMQQIFYDRGTFVTPAYLTQVDGVARNVSGVNVTTGSPSPDWTSISMS